MLPPPPRRRDLEKVMILVLCLEAQLCFHVVIVASEIRLKNQVRLGVSPMYHGFGDTSPGAVFSQTSKE